MTKDINYFIALTDEQSAGISMRVQQVQTELDLPKAVSQQTPAMHVLTVTQQLSEFLVLQESLEAEDANVAFTPEFAAHIQQTISLTYAISANIAGVEPPLDLAFDIKVTEPVIHHINTFFTDVKKSPGKNFNTVLEDMLPALVVMYKASVDARFAFSALAEPKDVSPSVSLVDNMFMNLNMVVKVAQARVDANAYHMDTVPVSLSGNYNRHLADAYTHLVTAARIVLITGASPVVKVALGREPREPMEVFIDSINRILGKEPLSVEDVDIVTGQVSGMESVVKDHLSKIQTIMSEEETEASLEEKEDVVKEDVSKLRSKLNSVSDTVKKYSPTKRTWKWIGVGAAAVTTGIGGAYLYKKFGRKVTTVPEGELENNPSVEVVVTEPVSAPTAE